MADTLIASGSLAQVQTHLSLVAGTAFADLQGVNLGLYLGKKLVVWDSAMRPASAYLGVAGTGETLGSNVITDGSPFVDGSWTKQAGWTVSGNKAVATGTSDAYIYQIMAGRAGYLEKWSVTPDTASGTYWQFHNGNQGGPTHAPGAVTVLDYITVVTSGSTWSALRGTLTANFSNLSRAQVLTPSIMGAIVSSKPSGTPGDAWSIAPNFNYNDTSGYTWAILSESSSIMYSFPEDKTQIDRRPRNKVYNEPFASFQSPGSAPRLVYPVLVDDIRKHTNLKAFSRAYYEPWGRFSPPTSAPRLPLTADVSDKTDHTNRKVPRAYFDFASKAPTQKDGNINPSPIPALRYRGWASNWLLAAKENDPWS